YLNRARLQKACELVEQCFNLAQSMQDLALLQEVHRMLGSTVFYQGELVSARMHFAQGIALYDTQQGHWQAFSSGADHGVVCLSYRAWTLWLLGYPEQAVTRSCEALTLAQESSHAYSLAFALNHASVLHGWCREVQLAQDQAKAVMRLASEQGFIHF